MRLLAEALRGLRLIQERLELLPANHGVKVALARRLRRETTMSLKWIAQRLGMGSWKYLSHLLSEEATADSDQAELGL